MFYSYFQSTATEYSYLHWREENDFSAGLSYNINKNISLHDERVRSGVRCSPASKPVGVLLGLRWVQATGQYEYNAQMLLLGV